MLFNTVKWEKEYLNVWFRPKEREYRLSVKILLPHRINVSIFPSDLLTSF